jgi:hypothetical protein
MMKYLYFFTILSLLLGACSPSNTAVNEATPESTATIALSVTPTPTNTEKPTIAPTETVTPTKTPGPLSRVPSCTKLQVQKEFPADIQISGVMLSVDTPSYSSSSGISARQKIGLHQFDFQTRNEIPFLNIDDYQQHIKTKIIRIGVEDLSVSPDFQKAVYLVDVYAHSDWEVSQSWLEIYNSNSAEKRRIPWKDEWAYIIGWLNDENFAVRSGGSILVFDVSGNIKKQFLASRFPDYSNPRVYSPSVFVLWGGYRKHRDFSFDSGGGNLASVYLFPRDLTRLYNPTLESLNPSLEYVIYTEVKNRKPGIVMYDIAAKQKIIEIMTGNAITPSAFGGLPVWSPVGNQAVMLLPINAESSKQALFLLDTEGKVEQLTTFEPLGPYSWSPDGNFVAFWLSNGRQIGLLDINNEVLQVFCLDGGYSNGGGFQEDGLTASGDLIWLPGNHQILVKIVKVLRGNYYDGVGILDLGTAQFIEIKWNAGYPAWLEK